jgi:hypothetical protein
LPGCSRREPFRPPHPFGLAVLEEPVESRESLSSISLLEGQLPDALTALLTFDLRGLEEEEGFPELFASRAERQVQAPEAAALGR